MSATASDLELLDAWRSGDGRSGELLFRRYFGQLNRFFHNKTDSGIEDLIQNTFLACIEGRDRFRAASSFRTYLFGIAHNVLCEHYRRIARTADFEHTSVVDLGASPTGPLTRRDEHAVLLRALRSIPLDYQVMLELAYWEGMKGPEIAEILAIPSNTVRSRLSRARAALREALERVASTPALLRSTLADLDGWARSIRAELEPAAAG
ncbi:MAG TPA: sigma-70 family RNA polymerase sigma factor [Enhygromyxa sp.]|nr:sigma-70 family RNA polymerase sigma factor [Enhygromyxa sp.]